MRVCLCQTAAGAKNVHAAPDLQPFCQRWAFLGAARQQHLVVLSRSVSPRDTASFTGWDIGLGQSANGSGEQRLVVLARRRTGNGFQHLGHSRRRFYSDDELHAEHPQHLVSTDLRPKLAAGRPRAGA